ncbi:MAG: acyloxyacyl hydrolase [Methylomicrobium sp.]
MFNSINNRFFRVYLGFITLFCSGLCSAEQHVVSEVKFGLLAYDVHIFSSSRKEEGVDVNGEILFNLPSYEFLGWIGNPRFHLGGSVNSEGDTDQGYFGLTWDYHFDIGVFVEGSFGGAVHDGKLNSYYDDRKSLGSRVLFRLSGSLGYQFDQHHSLAVIVDHISNAGLASPNEGMDNVGVRYGFRF